MGIPYCMMIITFLLIMELSEIEAVSNGGSCSTDSDCDDNTGLKCYRYYDGTTYCSTGTCGCGDNGVWLTSSCGTPVGAIGNACATTSQCSAAVTNSECSSSSHVCTCSSGYYSAGSYLCLLGPGTIALNSVCTSSNHCLRGLICTRCPGVSSGDMHCRSQSGAVTVNIGAAWMFVFTILSVTIMFVKT